MSKKRNFSSASQGATTAPESKKRGSKSSASVKSSDKKRGFFLYRKSQLEFVTQMLEEAMLQIRRIQGGKNG